MNWNGHTFIDMDAHIREQAGRSYEDYIDSAWREGATGLDLSAISRPPTGAVRSWLARMDRHHEGELGFFSSLFF